jgi:hypothetical protein
MLSAKTILYTFSLGALVLTASLAAFANYARTPRRQPLAPTMIRRTNVTSPSPERGSRSGEMRCGTPMAQRALAPCPTLSFGASAKTPA